MKNKCPRCNLTNSDNAKSCVKCLFKLTEVSSNNGGKSTSKSLFLRIVSRAAICFIVVFLAIAGFYYSLIVSADPLTAEQYATVDKAIIILEEKGFTGEVFYLRRFTAFRGSDNWLNASVPKENAYAATNYPFEIMTIYPDFFTYPVDDVERAAILLHEAKHLEGYDEKVAYAFVWKNKDQLGWTKERYKTSVVWQEIRKQTKEYAPNLFVCDFNQFNDCTE